MNKIIKKIKSRIAYYVKTWEMPKMVAIDLVLSDFRHYKKFDIIESYIR